MLCENYTIMDEPSIDEKKENWDMAIGLQSVDGLHNSQYLRNIAKEHICGNMSISEAKHNIYQYYEKELNHKEKENRTEEADKASINIVEILGEKTYNFIPDYLINIHKRIFEGFDFAGKIRTCNITKKEPVLNGDTVCYSDRNMILPTLQYDFYNESQFDYSHLTRKTISNHIADFISDIWQVHPFMEGNTRTTAVFIIKYLQKFNFKINSDMFLEHSAFFRNALVRANFSNINLDDNKKFLYDFFDNLLLGGQHILNNEDIVLDNYKIKLGGWFKRDIDNDGLILCDIQAKAFELSYDYTDCSSLIFIRRFMKSKIVEILDNSGILRTTLHERDLLERIEEEYGKTNYGQIKYEKEVLYWIGYIYRYFAYICKMRSSQVYKIIKPNDLYEVYFSYHTLSPAQAIEKILESKNIDINETELERQYKVFKRIYLEDMEKHKHI